MDSENRPSANQPQHPALTLIAKRAMFFAQRGAVVASWRYKKGQKLGPYLRLYYREDGRQRSVYLGREGPLVEQVREELARLQQFTRRRREFQRVWASATASLRRAKAELDRQLRPLGLVLKGYELRGWRSHPLLRWVSSMMRLPNVVPTLRLPLPPPLPSPSSVLRMPRFADPLHGGYLRC